MKIAVIGGTRFIGRAIVEHLVGAGDELLLLHRGNSEPPDLPEVEHLHVDRNEIQSASDQIKDFGPEAIIDTSAISGQQAEMAIAAVPNDSRLIVLSSVDTFLAYDGMRRDELLDPNMPITESSPVRTDRFPYRGVIPGMDDYEKLDVEEAYLGADGVVLRLPVVFGPRDYQRREEFLLGRVRAGRKRVPMGAGEWIHARLFVRDVATAVKAVLDKDIRKELFVLAEAEQNSVRTWMGQILEAAQSDAELVEVADDKLPEDLALTGTIVQPLAVDSSKAQKILGWTPASPNEGVPVSVRWHLENPPEETPDFSADDQALAH